MLTKHELGQVLVLLRKQIGRTWWLAMFFLLAAVVAVKAGDFTYVVNSNETITITHYNGSDETVFIPSAIDGKTVICIGDKAFSSCTNLTAITVDAANYVYCSVDGVLFDRSKTVLIQCPGGKAGSYTIPGTVASIGDGAFRYCTSLTGITIPNSVTRIGNDAFEYCIGLTGITISSSVVSIGNDAFLKCAGLAAITVDTGNSVYSSVAGVLFDKSKVTLIQYPGGQAGSYTIPNNVTIIGDAAFYSCASLTGVTIPNTITSIVDAAFQDCASLTEITVGALNSTYCSVDGVLFDRSKTMLIQCPGGKTGSYTIPGTVTSIGDGAFKYCASLTSVTIPSSVTNIGDDAFYACTSLTGITIPNSVTRIGNGAFYSCNSLTNVTIPNNVTSIGSCAFCDCTSLTEITVGALNSTYCSVDGVLFNRSKTTLVQYPGGRAGSYTIPGTVANIGDGAFKCCTSLTGITIPNSVTRIGSEAFWRCTGLTGVTIPNTITSIGDAALRGCTSLIAIAVDAANSVYCSVDGVLFDRSKTVLIQCPGGQAGSYTIPNSVTRIGDGAFKCCTSLTGVTMPASVTSIGDAAFQDCTSLTEITVGALNSTYCSVNGVLFNKSKTMLVQCPGGQVGSYAIPASVTRIGDAAFFSCANLSSIAIPDNVASIGSGVFPGCTSLINVTMPASVTNIANYAFYNCASLRGIYFKGNAPAVGSSVFDGDNNATAYYLPGATGWGVTLSGRPAVLCNASGPPIGGSPTISSNVTGPIIKANGTEGEITIYYPEILSVTVEMNAGEYEGIPVDWWVVANAWASWFYLDSVTGWVQADVWHPANQGGLMNLPATEVLNISGLQAGSYTFYFAVDYPMDGILHLEGPILFDAVNVTVK